jgi:hypothetical protein
MIFEDRYYSTIIPIILAIAPIISKVEAVIQFSIHCRNEPLWQERAVGLWPFQPTSTRGWTKLIAQQIGLSRRACSATRYLQFPEDRHRFDSDSHEPTIMHY